MTFFFIRYVLMFSRAARLVYIDIIATAPVSCDNFSDSELSLLYCKYWMNDLPQLIMNHFIFRLADWIPFRTFMIITSFFSSTVEITVYNILELSRAQNPRRVAWH